MKLHLGCGKVHLPGFVNVDIDPCCKPDVLDDIRYLHTIWGTSCFELIYCCHVLEHFSRHEVPYILQRWHILLAPDGVLRLAVPDFNRIMDWMDRNGNLADVLGLMYGGQNSPTNYHRNVFDYGSLSDLLRASKFHEVRRWDWRETEHADHDDYSQAYLPHMDKDNGMLMSLNVEATKP